MDLLPTSPGLLPKWQLFVATIALLNSIQNLFTTSVTKQLYAAQPAQVTPLQARMSAFWNFTSAVVRAHAAYNINDRAVYNMAMWTYGIALAHFGSEFVVFRTGKLNGPFISPLIVASTSLVWMYLQKDFYVQ